MRLLVAMVSAACVVPWAPAAPVPAAPAAFMPLAKGTKWEYQLTVKGTEVEMTQEVTKVVEAKGERPQATVTTTGKNILTAEVLSVDGKGLYRHSFNGIEVPKPLTTLKLPAKAGTKWTEKFTLAEMEFEATSEVLEQETVTVEAGEYKAFPVRAVLNVMGQTMTFRTWYAAGVGIVKQEADANGVEVKMQLKKFTPAKSP